MKRFLILLLIPLLLLWGCKANEQPVISDPATQGATQPPATEPEITEPESTEPATTESTEPETTEATEAETTEPTEPEPTEPEHSALYIPGVSVENVITYFNEVCLDAEFVHSGDASLLQRWEMPVCYSVEGSPTAEDLEVLEGFTDWLNTVENFPGIRRNQSDDFVNLRIHFCTQEELLAIMGDHFTGLDGAVTFWYNGDNAIFDAVICVRTDLDQYVRNSVIQEEIYNGLGPIQDTNLRQDSLIYSGYTTPQEPTQTDRLIMELLYHPSLSCGMTAQECEEAIRQLYY